MSARATPNYPDILGAITGGPRCNVNVVQLALAVRPRVVRAGRPFEAILLVQNASDVDVDVTAVLNLPREGRRQAEDQFTSGHTRLLVGLHPAEVGYVTLPVACATTTAPHEGYKLGMNVQVKPLSKAQRIRYPQGGGEIKAVSSNLKSQIDDLDRLHFSVDKHFGLSDELEASFGVLPGRLGRIVDTRPDWVSLWTMADHEDHSDLFSAYAPLLVEQLLPMLTPEHTLAALQEVTETYFERAAYPLEPIEALFVAKMLARVLQLANPVGDLNDYQAENAYNVLRTIKRRTEDGIPATECDLPYWCQGMVKVIAGSKEALQHPVQVISQMLYLDLVRDAVPLAIELIQRQTGEDVGNAEEARAYGDQLAERLKAGTHVNFEHAYMPLILGGLIVGNKITARKTRLDEEVRDLQEALGKRSAEQTDQNAPIFQMAGAILDKSTRQYTFMP